MRADTFKNWLRKKGCRFDSHEHERGEGHSSLEIKLGDRRATLPLVGTHQNIPAPDISRILHDLNLHAQDLPGPMGKAGPQPEERSDRLLARQAKAALAAARKDRNSGAKP